MTKTTYDRKKKSFNSKKDGTSLAVLTAGLLSLSSQADAQTGGRPSNDYVEADQVDNYLSAEAAANGDVTLTYVNGRQITLAANEVVTFEGEIFILKSAIAGGGATAGGGGLGGLFSGGLGAGTALLLGGASAAALLALNDDDAEDDDDDHDDDGGDDDAHTRYAMPWQYA